MKQKHLKVRIEQCLALAKLSNCPRRKFGALLLDPERNQVLCDSYNGGPRSGGELCGGSECLRDKMNIESGTRVEVGCHHAEQNLICNAAASGVPATGSWLFVTGEPCLMCSKLIHHSGIARVVVIGGGYMGDNGIEYLREHDIPVSTLKGPQDPRLNEGSLQVDPQKVTDPLRTDEEWPGAKEQLEGDDFPVMCDCDNPIHKWGDPKCKRCGNFKP